MNDRAKIPGNVTSPGKIITGEVPHALRRKSLDTQSDDGWKVYAGWTKTLGEPPISEFKTTWTVPPIPEAGDAGQSVFLFSGLSPANHANGVLQPVLQWGPAEAGHIEGSWAVTSWCALPNGLGFSTVPVPVDVGDELVAVMRLFDYEDGDTTFSYLCEFEGISGTQLEVHDLPSELVWCNLVLESYTITNQSDYPTGATAFSNIEIKTHGGNHPPLEWATYKPHTNYGEDIDINSFSNPDGIITITY